MDASEWNLDKESSKPESGQFVYPFAQIAREAQVESSRFYSHQGSKSETEHKIGKPVETGILLIATTSIIMYLNHYLFTFHLHYE